MLYMMREEKFRNYLCQFYIGSFYLFFTYITRIEETAEETLNLVKRINAEVEAMSAEIKEKLPKIYSTELIDLLFYEFYTKIIYIENGLSVSRKTAVNYLTSLEKEGLKNFL